MLTRLTVENYALIDKLELVLDPQLNIITGETGAGKSILLGALGLLLGARNDGAAAADASRNCVVEGLFDIGGLGLQSLFDEQDLEYDDQTVIRRIITPSGKSRSFVNDMPVQLSQVRELGAQLIDIHSQHRNPILSSPSFRVHAADTMAGSESLAAGYRSEYARLTAAERELARLRAEAESGRRDMEWIRFQAGELTAANLREGEVAELEAEQALLSSADTTGETLAAAAQIFNDEERGVLPQLKAAEQALRKLQAGYPSSSELAERLHSAMLEIKDVAATVAADAERIESDPERLAAVDARLAAIWSLCRKHRVGTESELIVLRDRFVQQLGNIESGDEQIAALEAEIEGMRERATALAAELHERRAAAIPEFAAEMTHRLTMLGMPDAVFDIRLEPAGRLAADGMDEVSFVFTANRNMPPQPIERIASGGEMSRMMLALKSLLARRMNLPTIVFDEIDTGVSGRIADAMGEITAALSETMQVVSITHLPQAASKGKAHFVVYKQDGCSNIRRLTPQERITEIAKMLSGSEVTEAALSQARNLLGMR